MEPHPVFRIDDDIFLSNLSAATSQTVIDNLSPVRVITLTHQSVPATTDHHPLDDGLNYQHQFAAAVDSTLDAFRVDGPVLVHCHAGVSRSPAVLATALAADRGVSFSEALTRVKNEREQAHPRPPLRMHARHYLGTQTIQQQLEDSLYNVPVEEILDENGEGSPLDSETVADRTVEELEGDIDDAMEDFDGSSPHD